MCNFSVSYSFIVEYVVFIVFIFFWFLFLILLIDGDYLGNIGGYFVLLFSIGWIGKLFLYVVFRDQLWIVLFGVEQFLVVVLWKEMGCCIMQVREKKLSLFFFFLWKLVNWDKMRIGWRFEVLQRVFLRYGEVCDIVVDWCLFDCSVGDVWCEGQDWYYGCIVGYGLK